MIDNTEPYINSEDIIKRIHDLAWQMPMFDDDITELTSLIALNKQGESLADWEFGINLIREDEFVDYTKQYAEDIGYVKSDTSWPFNCIDWVKAADELLVDYTHLDFDGVTYYAR